jgi:hypothetical protein
MELGWRKLAALDPSVNQGTHLAGSSEHMIFPIKKFIPLLSALVLMALPAYAQGSGPGTHDSIGDRLATIMTVKKVGERLQKLSECGEKLSTREVPQALAMAKNFKQFRERVVFQKAALKRWAVLEPCAAFAYIAALPESRTKLEVLSFAAVKLAEGDPEKAAMSAAGLPPGPSRSNAINAVAESWAKTDGGKSANWIKTLPVGSEREGALYSLLFVWVHRDPAASWSLVEKLEPDSRRKALVANIASEWAARDHQIALQWADSLSDEGERDLAYQNIAESWADYDPRAASDFVLSMPPGKARQMAATATAIIWGKQNPQEAATWIAEKLDLNCQSEAATQLLKFWTTVEPQEAGNWAKALPSGSLRETAISTYADTAVYLTPEAAVEVVLAMSDENSRQQKLATCIRQWMETDKIAASKWLQEAHVSSQFKNRMRSVEESVNYDPSHP